MKTVSCQIQSLSSLTPHVYKVLLKPSESVNFIEKSEFRHREVLGPEAFQSLTERMDARQKNTFRLLGIKRVIQ